MHLDIKASVSSNRDDKAFAEAHERMFGWKCFYCRQEGESIVTKEAKCPRCKRIKEEAKI